jgi:membrane protein
MKPAELLGLLRDAAKRWNDSRASTLGAALAYYTLFSLAPLLVIALVIASKVFGPQASSGELARTLSSTIGAQPAQAVQELLAAASQPGAGLLPTLIGIIMLLFGASGVFGELQHSLNRVWGVDARPGRGIWGIVQDRFLSFAMVLGTCLLLLASIVATTTLEAVSHYWSPAALPGGAFLWRLLDVALALVLILLLFAMLLRFLPDVKLGWKDVWLGAALAALLFTIGKYLLSLYLSHSSVTSAYGAAGSVVVILVWVYYSAQIFLFGAAFTRVQAQHACKAIEPTGNAVLVERRG